LAKTDPMFAEAAPMTLLSEADQLREQLGREIAARAAAESRAAESERALLVLHAQVEELGRMKNDMMRNMSHELRTPLNAIIGFTSLLLGRLEGKVGGEDLEYLRFANGGANDLLRIINQALEMTKLLSGNYVFEADRVSVPSALRACLEMRREALEQAAIQPVLEAAPELPDVIADRSALTKCLLIVLDNAIKFSNGGSEILLAADAGEGGINIAIADRGIGIPPDYLDRIGQPFVQADNRLAKDKSGVGLGLAIARSLLEKQGGRLRITSHLGHGTTVHLRLKAA
jgi:two-component system, cell cycle sensor histidine kinase PleC